MVGKEGSTSKIGRTGFPPDFWSCATATLAKSVPPRKAPAATAANTAPMRTCLLMSQLLLPQSPDSCLWIVHLREPVAQFERTNPPLRSQARLTVFRQGTAAAAA